MKPFDVAGLLAGALLALAAGPALAQVPDKFADCVAKDGKEFRQARDQFLALPADQTRDLLQQKLDSDDWRERLTARILLGWQEHTDEYRELLAAPRQQNQKGDPHYRWAVPPGSIKAQDVPLMVELLVKGDDPDGAQDAATALLALVKAKPDTPLDVRGLHGFLREGKAGEAQRKPVAWLVGTLPAKYQDAGELLKTLKAELARGDKDRGLVEALLGGFSRAAERLSPEQRDNLVKQLLEMAELKDVLGNVPLTYAVGNIGGDKASEEVARYLAQADSPVEQRWALRALGRSNSDAGTRYLLQYAGDKNLAEPVRVAAIEALGRSKWRPEVGEKLQAIAMDGNVPAGQRLQAVRSLETVSARHPKDGDLQRQIRSRIETISSSAPGDDKLQKELKTILHNLEK